MRFDPSVLLGNNNPMLAIINSMKSGGDPNILIQHVMNSNPQLKQIADGKTPEQLLGIAENMCRERGTSVDDVLKQLGITR